MVHEHLSDVESIALKEVSALKVPLTKIGSPHKRMHCHRCLHWKLPSQLTKHGPDMSLCTLCYGIVALGRTGLRRMVRRAR